MEAAEPGVYPTWLFASNFFYKTCNAAGLIKENGGKIIHEEAWGLRKLAYPIQKKTTGFYHLIEFECDAEYLRPFETEFRRDERIIRFLSTRMEKDHVEYAEKRRNKAAQPQA